MAKVGVAVIGVGGWGKNHARVYYDLNQLCVLKAVCDKDAGRAKYYGDLYKAEWTSDLSKLLDREDIEAVSVCTPSDTHYEVAMEVLKAGKNLLLEKPMALRINEALEIHRNARLRRLKLMVGFIERFNQGVQKVKEVIEKKELGFVRQFCASRISLKPSASASVDIVKDTAIHDLDVVRFVSGEEPVNVYAENVRNVQPSKKFESVEMFLFFRSGKTAHITAEWLEPEAGHIRKIRQLQVTGSNGTVILSYIPQLVWKIDAVDILSPFIDKKGRPKYSRNPREATLIAPLVWDEPLKLELKSFLDSIINDEPPAVSGIEGIRTLEIAEAALNSAKAGRPKEIKYKAL